MKLATNFEPHGNADETQVDALPPWYDVEGQAQDLLVDPEPVTTEADIIPFPGAFRALPQPQTQPQAQPQPPAQPVASAPSAPDIPYAEMPPVLPWWRRMWTGEALMHKNRLTAACLLVNAVFAHLLLAQGLLAGPPVDAVATISHWVVGNFTVAILIRQQYVINALFWLATRPAPFRPLWLRRNLAKVYHFGGIHVGTAIAGTLWFLLLAAVVFVRNGQLAAVLSAPTVFSICILAAVLVVICLASRPKMRMKHHDSFELIKRFGGWLSLALFWLFHLGLTHDLGGAQWMAQLATAPATWALCAITVSIALPWMRLRKVPVRITTPSNHVAIAEFDYGVTPFPGSSTTLSLSPLGEWHAFANIPTPGKSGYRLAISRAGDWTGALIESPPSHIWVKGIPTAGVANIEVLFKRVLYVATGSGIGPCLPHLLGKEVPANLFWSTRDPRKTYGDDIVDEIVTAIPDAVIWDTEAHGKPDMVQTVYNMVAKTGAEAVICISNKKLTWQVVKGMESRGIPAYGAIWDS